MNKQDKVSYYHDKYNIEANCVIHLQKGDYALIEFKLARENIGNAAEKYFKLNNLIKKIIRKKITIERS